MLVFVQFLILSKIDEIQIFEVCDSIPSHLYEKYLAFWKNNSTVSITHSFKTSKKNKNLKFVTLLWAQMKLRCFLTSKTFILYPLKKRGGKSLNDHEQMHHKERCVLLHIVKVQGVLGLYEFHYRVTQHKLYFLKQLWKIEACKLDLIWWVFWNAEIMNFWHTESIFISCSLSALYWTRC